MLTKLFNECFENPREAKKLRVLQKALTEEFRKIILKAGTSADKNAEAVNDLATSILDYLEIDMRKALILRDWIRIWGIDEVTCVVVLRHMEGILMENISSDADYTADFYHCGNGLVREISNLCNNYLKNNHKEDEIKQITAEIRPKSFDKESRYNQTSIKPLHVVLDIKEAIEKENSTNKEKMNAVRAIVADKNTETIMKKFHWGRRILLGIKNILFGKFSEVKQTPAQLVISKMDFLCVNKNEVNNKTAKSELK